MISRSGKTLIKRSKHSYEQYGEDIISKLPEALLIYILSLLPKPLDAIRTCILSKRWKHLWVFCPNLYFDLPYSLGQSAKQVKTFHDCVDNALALRSGMLVQSFFLSSFSPKYDYDRVLNSLSIVVQSKLEILELYFPNKVNFSWNYLKACSTLVELTLCSLSVSNIPQVEFLLPCLKKVNLTCVEYSGDDQSPQDLVSRCPVLQELSLELQSLHSLHSTITNISSPYLKKLRIENCKFGREVLIDAPRLEYLYIVDYSMKDTKYSTKNPLSLVEAHISRYDRTVVELLTCVSAAKGLTLGYMSLHAIYDIHNSNVATMFPNLVKLDVNGMYFWDWDFWSMLFKLLNKMPLLEKITIAYGRLPEDNVSWSPPVEAPTCLCFKMKEIILRNAGDVTRTQLILTGYLLRHSTILEKLKLNAHNIDHERREQLLNLYRGSNICQIEFV